MAMGRPLDGMGTESGPLPQDASPGDAEPPLSIDREWIVWSHPPGLNRRPADYESAALPAELGWPGCGTGAWAPLFNMPHQARVRLAAARMAIRRADAPLLAPHFLLAPTKLIRRPLFPLCSFESHPPTFVSSLLLRKSSAGLHFSSRPAGHGDSHDGRFCLVFITNGGARVATATRSKEPWDHGRCDGSGPHCRLG